MPTHLERDAVHLALPLHAAHDAAEARARRLARLQPDIVRTDTEQAPAARRQAMVVAREEPRLSEAHARKAADLRDERLDGEEVGTAEELGGEAVGRVAVE